MVMMFIIKEAVSKKSLTFTGFLQSIVQGVFLGRFFVGVGDVFDASTFSFGSFIKTVGVSLLPETDGMDGSFGAGTRYWIGLEGAVLEVARVASDMFDLKVAESPFSSPRTPLMLGQRWRVNWCGRSSSTSSGITNISSVKPHLVNSLSMLSSESMDELLISTAQFFIGQYW